MSMTQPSPATAVKTQKAVIAEKAVKKVVASKAAAPSTSVKKTATADVELPVQNQIPPFTVKKKKNDKKVIRDSFSFPHQDYHKISELKKICLAAGVHVKKGELLRAGLNLLTDLKLTELLQAVEKVEKVRTGRPKSKK